MFKVEILIVAETKIDASFLTAQVLTEGYHKQYRLDVSKKGDDILVYLILQYSSDSYSKYRPIRMLPLLSKVYESTIFN